MPPLPMPPLPSKRRRAMVAMAAMAPTVAAWRGPARASCLTLCFALCFALTSAPPAHAQAEPFTLAELTRLLAQVKAGDATFTEKRAVAVLDRTLESTGRLSFAAPDTFVRETLKPRQEKLAVVGNTVTLSQGTRTRTVALDSVPEAAVIVEAVRGTLTGNRDALERHFSTRVSGSAPRWALELTPLDVRLRGQVASVRVAGTQGVVREVTVALADGDRSVMTIEPVPIAARPASAPN